MKESMDCEVGIVSNVVDECDKMLLLCRVPKRDIREYLYLHSLLRWCTGFDVVPHKGIEDTIGQLKEVCERCNIDTSNIIGEGIVYSTENVIHCESPYLWDIDCNIPLIEDCSVTLPQVYTTIPSGKMCVVMVIPSPSVLDTHKIISHCMSYVRSNAYQLFFPSEESVPHNILRELGISDFYIHSSRFDSLRDYILETLYLTKKYKKQCIVGVSSSVIHVVSAMIQLMKQNNMVNDVFFYVTED